MQLFLVNAKKLNVIAEALHSRINKRLWRQRVEENSAKIAAERWSVYEERVTKGHTLGATTYINGSKQYEATEKLREQPIHLQNCKRSHPALGEIGKYTNRFVHEKPTQYSINPDTVLKFTPGSAKNALNFKVLSNTTLRRASLTTSCNSSKSKVLFKSEPQSPDNKQFKASPQNQTYIDFNFFAPKRNSEPLLLDSAKFETSTSKIHPNRSQIEVSTSNHSQQSRPNMDGLVQKRVTIKDERDSNKKSLTKEQMMNVDLKQLAGSSSREKLEEMPTSLGQSKRKKGCSSQRQLQKTLAVGSLREYIGDKPLKLNLKSNSLSKLLVVENSMRTAQNSLTRTDSEANLTLRSTFLTQKKVTARGSGGDSSKILYSSTPRLTSSFKMHHSDKYCTPFQ